MAGEIESAEVIRQRIAEQLERQQKAAQALRTSGSFITFKNATLKVNGQPVPNNQAEVRVLAAIPERAWYDGPYDPDEPQVPACYALDSGEPHPEASDPQSETCMGCPKNKWGTAPPRPGSNVPGKGKACREGARVIVSPANIPLKSAPMYTAKVPVTSLSAIQTYMDRCANSGRMMGEFIGVLGVHEDKRSFFKVSLDIKEHTADLDQITLMNKQDQAMELALQPYPNLNSEE
jgi:hypothetical protein